MAKKRLSRRDFLMVSAGTVGAGLLASCAPEVVKETVKETVVVEQTVEVERTVEVEKIVEVEKEVQPAPPEEVELLFWNYWGAIEPKFVAMLDMFMERYPWIKVKYELLPWDQYWQKLNATLVTGNPPDVWFTAPTFYFEYVDRGQLVDLTPYLDMDEDASEDSWYPSALDMWRTGPEGHLYGLPSDLVSKVLFYNKDIFDEAGVEYPTEDWTWDDCLVAAQAITKDTDRDGKTDVWGIGAAPLGWHLDQIIESNGGQVINEEQTKCLLADSPEAIETIQFMVDLIHKYKVAPPAGEFEGMGNPFLTGRVGMQIDNTTRALDFKDAPFDWDNALMPGGSAKRVNYGGSNGFVVSAPTKHPEEAYMLVKFLTSQAGPIYYIGTGLSPVRKELAASPAFLKQPPPPEHFDVWTKAIECADNNFGRGFSEWQTAKNSALEAAYLGGQSVDEAVQAACEAMDAVLEKIATEKEQGS